MYQENQTLFIAECQKMGPFFIGSPVLIQEQEDDGLVRCVNVATREEGLVEEDCLSSTYPFGCHS